MTTFRGGPPLPGLPRNVMQAGRPYPRLGLKLLCRTLSCLLPLCLMACAWTKPNVEPTVSAPVVTGVSRVIIPSNGGQTIIMPRLMSDVGTLWSPLNAREKRRHSTPLNVDAELAKYDIASWLPSTEYDTMSRYLYRLTNDQKELTGRVLARANNYMPIILEGVRRQGLPVELACLPLVESAFEPQAISPAGAAGIWQLMPGTARDFGLKVTDTVDERFDVQKSTDAATAYLAYLYRFFDGNWPLAIAAYNCGEGTMKKALAGSSCTTLDGLTAYCRRVESDSRPLKEETLRYVPQLTAAIIAMNGTERFGLGAGPPLRGTERFDLGAVRPLQASAVIAGGRKDAPEKLTLSGRYDFHERPVPTPPKSTRIQ